MLRVMDVRNTIYDTCRHNDYEMDVLRSDARCLNVDVQNVTIAHRHGVFFRGESITSIT